MKNPKGIMRVRVQQQQVIEDCSLAIFHCISLAIMHPDLTSNDAIHQVLQEVGLGDSKSTIACAVSLANYEDPAEIKFAQQCMRAFFISCI